MDASYAFPDAKKDASSARTVDELPKAIDLSHHLNLLSRSRGANSLKSLYKYMQQPGMISLAGGMPHYEIFPFQSVSAEIYQPNALDKKPPTSTSTPTDSSLKPSGLLSWLLGSKSTKTVTVPKTPEALRDPNAVDLSTLLQYSSSEGHPALRAFIREFTEKVYQPGYADWQVQLTLGTTGGWAQVVNMLLERGDAVLVEEFTYPGAINAWQPLGCRQVAIKMDGEGILPEDLERILANWDEKKEGVRRPRLLYTVPTGQNPTGGTMFGDRKQKIYDICVKYDVIIGEDEPYYFLYADPWIPQGQKQGQNARADLHAAMKSGDKKGVENFFKQLPPSYLKYDYQGRVIRMDTFSKTIAPGVRLGWFTANPLFTERLLRGCEGTYGSPNGIGQAMIAKLLIDWGYDGYIRWLRGIKATYAMRRDWMCDILESTFHLEFDQVLPLSNSIKWVTAYEKLPEIASGKDEKGFTNEKGMVKSRKALVSFVPPSAGMFVWLAVHLENHPEYKKLRAAGEDPARVLIEKLWIQLAENNVLISPGFFFEGEKGMVHEGAENIGFYRLAFSNASKEQMETSIKTMYHTFVQFFKE